MSHLWYTRDGEWIAESLSAERALGEWTGDDASLVRIAPQPGGPACYALLAPAPSVRVNGEPLPTGIRVLRDRDEILCRTGQRLWFSTERVAEITRFRGSGDAGVEADEARCPRCRDYIEQGTEAVACPNCGVFYHFAADRHCYDYHAECVICRGPTRDLSEQTLAWTPCAL
jgi:hypothetical protein